MTRRGLQRLGYVLLDTEPLWMPGADGYADDGTPYFRSQARARDWARREGDLSGRIVRVNPDGGPKTAADLERELLEKRRLQAESRAARIARRSRLKPGGRIPTSRSPRGGQR